MLGFFMYYLLFVIILTVIVGFVVLNMRAPSFRAMVVIVFLFFFLPLLIGYLYLMYFAPLPEAVVPDVTRIAFDEAVIRLEKTGLNGRLAGRVFENTVAEGSIVSQKPEAGRVVKKGRIVNLIVSSGSRKVIVPNLLNRPFVQANAVLAAEGLEIGLTGYEEVSGYQSDVILAQEPLPGEEVDVGTRVNLTISSAEGEYVEERVERKQKEEKQWWQPF